MSQKLPVNGFELVEYTSQFSEDFIKSYNEENYEVYLFEVDIQYPKKWNNLHNDFPFLSEWMKIERFKKLVANLHDKTEYVIHIRNLKQALNNRPVLRKVYRFIRFNEKP